MDMKTKLYVTKIFGNDLVVIRKSKVTLKLSRPVHVRMCILSKLSKVFM